MIKQLQVLISPDNSDSGQLKPFERVVEVVNESRYEWLKQGVVGLQLVDDASIRALNKQYGGRDEPTDVLSFDYNELPSAGAVENEIGDMVISLETAERQAEMAGTTMGDEVALLGLHGVLHLHGFDHATKDEQDEMDRLQSEILKKAAVEYRKFEWKD